MEPESSTTEKLTESDRRTQGKGHSLAGIHPNRSNEALCSQVVESGSSEGRSGSRMRLASAATGGDSGSGTARRERRRLSLRRRMEELRVLEERIEREFGVLGTFLDVDVVGAIDLKRDEVKPSKIVLSFERWRDWLESIVEEFEGQVLNSNGDEFMCFFEAESHALRAVLAGSAMLRRLDRFNVEENLLEKPFRLRLGVNTGESLVDRQRGCAYSTVVDAAGHLQKRAAPNKRPTRTSL